MVLARLIAFALAGALGGALLAFAVQFHLLHGAGADPLALDAASLLVEVMALHHHGLLGALVGVILGPFPAPPDQPLWGTLRWLLAGLVVTLLWPLVPLLQAAGSLPTVAELAAGYRFPVGIIPAGLGASLACGVMELALLVRRSRRQVAFRPYRMGGENQVDETLREFWQSRADSYLAGKSRGAGRDGRG